MNIYVASSWRNERQPEVVKALREAGHDVYDFREPAPGVTGFAWSDIDPNWQQWTPSEFRDALYHPIAVDGFNRDHDAMLWAEAFVMVMPCGRSAHLEAGWGTNGEPTAILLSNGEPELMYRLALISGGELCVDLDEVLAWADKAHRKIEESRRPPRERRIK
jgi:hypothetical protein